MTEVINKYKQQLTWALAALALVALLLFLGDQLAGKKAARILQTLISGVLVGGVYGLVALGIVVINKASGVFNFAHGWMMVLGGMIFWSFFTVSQISIPGAVPALGSDHVHGHDDRELPFAAAAAQFGHGSRRHAAIDHTNDHRRH